MPQSPELAGGEGFTFEGDAAAFYLAALLAEGYAPGIDDRVVVRVAVQQRDFGEPLDDVIVDFEGATGDPARLSLQVKRSLTISKAKSNEDFRDIICDSWTTLGKPDFRRGMDRYGAAVGTITPDKERALKTLCDLARESLTTVHFDARFAKGGNAGPAEKSVRADIVALLEVAKGSPCTSEEVHRFLAHFVLLRFDFLREGAADPPQAINRIRDCLVPDDAAKAPLIWSRMVQLARSSAGKAGQFDRPRLVRSIAQVARPRGGTSLRDDLGKVSALAKSCAELIQDDVGGTKLERSTLLAELEAKLRTARLVQVRGLPGSGKSVLLRRAVQQSLRSGPTLFLKADQLEGTSWISYATSHGLSGASLEHLLVEIGATGTPILFIDAIDRVEKEHQPVVLEVIRTVVQSPLLDNWRIVVSLRDTGIEVLRNWLGDVLAQIEVEMLGVDALSDDEAEILAKAKPHLGPLLFGTGQVREIVRRPFFAKILNQSFVANPGGPPFTPQSEVDLIENWWKRGGYNSSGQNAVERQRAILDLAGVRARQLSQPIRLSQLKSVAYIDDLRTDGILQDARAGHSVRFAHDIFFEWAFFHVLADQASQWVDEIRACGEPPAVARVVELLSQWEYAEDQNWGPYLAQTETSGLRSQWMRAWLVGPLSSAKFEVRPERFATAVFADDLRLFEKALVWFQAEKTTPDPNILAGTLPQEHRQRFADLLGWPSDFTAWRRLITFILANIDEISSRLYPEIVAIFEVWQNALWNYANPISRAVLSKCAEWLREIDCASPNGEPTPTQGRWKQVPDFRDFRRHLVSLLLKSSQIEPTLTTEYLERVIRAECIRDSQFEEVVGFSGYLARSHPRLLVELTLAHLKEELPDDQVTREKRGLHEASKRRKAALGKPRGKRTRIDDLTIAGGFSNLGIGNFSHHDWERLSINRGTRGFWPPSPLREPFHALFQSAPAESLRQLRELCNHAIAAWRQLHRHSRHRGGTPIPLELTFPWGTQRFWGGDREYLWFRSLWAPKPLACGFLALEDWCFAELKQGRPLDELIQQIVEGNECIAILGVAVALALDTDAISEAVFPLITSQALWQADHNRMAHDVASNSTSLMGFRAASDQPHIEAVRSVNERAARKKELRWLVPGYVFGGEQFAERARAAISDFKNALPYRYEEERDVPAARERYLAQALEYEELADPKNYRAYRVKEGGDAILLSHESPSEARPEQQAKAEKAKFTLLEIHLWTWVEKTFEGGKIHDGFTNPEAITLAKQIDNPALFEAPEGEDDLIEMRRGAVAGAAAVALNFPELADSADLDWARKVLDRAISAPEKRDAYRIPGSIIPWHPSISVARGLAADLRSGSAEKDAATKLLALVAHPLEGVSLAAFREVSGLWRVDPKLGWSALILGFSLCHIKPRPPGDMRDPGDPLCSQQDAQAALEHAAEFYLNGEGWLPIPQPPPAWVKLDARMARGRRFHYADYADSDVTDPNEVWGEPDVLWYSQYAAKIIPLIPVEGIFVSDARSHFLEFMSSVLIWTNEKNAPSWLRPGHRDQGSSDLFEWTDELGSTLGRLAGLLPLADIKRRLLEPILQLENDNCWSLLAPFASSYVCRYIYDAATVPPDAVAVLELCLERLLDSSAFGKESYRGGEFSGFDQPRLVRTLMFVEIEHASGAARYVNGDWSEIARILPLIDRLVRAGGWAASVMDPYLSLCERAKASYPVDAFADQVLAVIGEGPQSLKGWRGTFLSARIAQLVQDFAGRDASMPLSLAQKLLRILDLLVDMGDRRSAALQLGEAFREIRLPS